MFKLYNTAKKYNLIISEQKTKLMALKGKNYIKTKVVIKGKIITYSL